MKCRKTLRLSRNGNPALHMLFEEIRRYQYNTLA